jgi:hypothetical protein
VFNCSICKESIGPGISPIKVVTGIRNVAYHNEFEREDEWGGKQKVEVDSTGTEITSEVLMCPGCGLADPVIGNQTSIIGARSFEEKLAPPFTVSLIAGAVASVHDRLGHNTKRAERDGFAVIPSLKAYLDAHKDTVL